MPQSLFVFVWDYVKPKQTMLLYELTVISYNALRMDIESCGERLNHFKVHYA